MNHKLQAAAVVFALLVCSISQAQWVPTTGIQGGQINCFEVQGSNTYAGTWGGGMFKSTNQGATWLQVGMIGEKVRSIADQDKYVYAGTHTGVWQSPDSGATWSKVITTIQYVYAMVNSAPYIIAGGYSGTNIGTIRSSDNGMSWSTSMVGTDAFPDVRAIAGASSDLYLANSGSIPGVYRSGDNGGTWTLTASQPANTNIQTLLYNGATLYAGTQGGVFVTTDGGSTWTNVSTGLTDLDVHSLNLIGTTLYAGTNVKGVFSSPVTPISWTAQNTGLQDSCVYAIIKNNNIMLGTNGGVFSSATGTSWAAANSGLTATRVYAMAVNGSTLFAGAYGSGLFRSTNDGVTWNPTSVANHYIHSMLVNGQSIYAGSEDGFYYSTDNGLTWNVAATGLGVADGNNVLAIAIHGTTLYAGTIGGGVYVSTDGGANWTKAAQVGLSNPQVAGLVFSGSTLFAGTVGGGVFTSTDGGATFTAVNAGLSGNSLFVNTMSVAGNTVFAGTYQDLFSTTNGGTTWTDITGSGAGQLGSNYIFCIQPSGTNFFVGTRNGGGLFYSPNYAPPYRDFGDSAGLQATWVSSMAINNSELYIGSSGYGVWRRPLTQMGYQVHANAKVYLQGPYVTSGDSMAIALKTGGYLAAHFSGVLIPTRAVDSINVELRSDSTSGTSTVRKFAPAWLLSDGTIRNFSDTTKSYVDFDSCLAGKYYLVIRHRNHLAIMGAVKDSIDAYANPAGRDFSTGQSAAYGFSPLVATGTKFSMYAGDVNGDGTLSYNFAGNDRAAILVRIGGTNINASVTGYYNEDVNLDGTVNYNGAGNDRAVILVNIGGTNINATVSTRVH